MDEKEKLIYFYYERLQAVRRAQKHYFALLLTFLGFVWAFYWNKPAASAANIFGMPLSDKSLLGITPGVCTLLLLGFVGSSRAVRPALELLRETWNRTGGTTMLELEVIDNHQNWTDYAMFIWARPFGHLFQAAAILGAIASTFAAGLNLNPQFRGYASFLFTAYCLLSVGVQGAACWKWARDKVAVSWHKNPEQYG